jgi:hypothetical protein
MRRNTLTNKYIPKGNTASKPDLEEGEVYFNNQTNSFHIGTSSGTDQIFSAADYYEFYGFFSLNPNPGVNALQTFRNTFPFTFSASRLGVGSYKIMGSDPMSYWSSGYLVAFVNANLTPDDDNNIRFISPIGGDETNLFIMTQNISGAYADYTGGGDCKIYVHFYLRKDHLNY